MDRSIIISNGRCGSTLLSDLIVEEPETCSAQEFFMSVAPWVRGDGLLTGAEYWSVLSSPKEEMAALHRVGLPPKEIRYPATGRWADNMVNLPRILGITLAKLTDDPDTLYDKLAARVPDFPSQTVGAHHQAFLDLLAEQTGRKRWVERSGGSSQIAPFILENFPTAKIVYLTRNWADTAASMSKHSVFQLIQLRIEALGRYGVDPFRVAPGQDVPAELEAYLPDRLTAELVRERGSDPKKFMALCAFMSSQAEQVLSDHPPAQLLTMAYEDLLVDPVGELTKLGSFLGFADPAGWADGVAHRVKSPVRA
ncbi:sulfotransferase [Actinoplanes friuliensis]|uniref:Methyltransferase n=1 Tax=Actinoplanes friuliensis DSM 7358 TaxID=1246995 RepID=U5WAI5_9ACTN|nr:sulfotransferase [Actinoplanes friuliensis]AGZ46203.1 methyltransferase [Actinoplanes friuliensis DSM 7358]